ncbi:Glycosyltransferase involved in cell wall bisynthesis [Streptoalloteichus tenebrarius]|uniref:Glycosyltransferase involved in cell wall bisynthesis n=1 Tax=Streptoalloteichus tenebrarius (strain ATCC 17920 / DSM 40477 / JCM 4838 / CBS 697.72 / NBRC 16177 / NCIMB 11028 / NRRL B-12390 / A12253. 1 / ISP 5477) TaxID=1933 RepID=A0ABT1HP36_STRSD|nr:glycosyltransferase family 4 protein [Streptoalloteichus tenebrarius]MCP2257273.1 Glycosyltransferase involved in cell wall bisynthesis [Streptoalloteichus tenebrarius]BFF04180.1 glycosyltransferase family 4 protein [Streptoalloteichus tenebrarius]
MFIVDSDAFGGAEIYVRRLVRLAPPWLRCHVVVSEEVSEHFVGRFPGTDVVVVPLARHRPTAPAITEALAALHPDVVHVNLVDPASNQAALSAALALAPTVATLHLEGETGHGSACDRLQRTYSRLTSVIAPSEPIARQLVGTLGVPPARVVRVRHGVDIPPRPRPPVDHEPPVVVAVGRLTPQKGFDLLFDAVAELCARGRRLRVVVAGEGRDAAALRDRADGLPVEFRGLCRDVPALLASGDVFCLPSRREALSLALLEAAAVGLPAVTTDVGDHRSALAGAALIVPPGDRIALTEALGHLLGDVALRRELGARARERAVRDFDARGMAARTAAVLASAALTTVDGPLRTEQRRRGGGGHTGSRWGR